MVNTHVVHIFNPRHECGDSRKTYLYKNPEGALFYRQTKRRERVKLDEDLRNMVEADFLQMHDLFSRGWTPKVKQTRSCSSCSLRDLCLPELRKVKSAKAYIEERLKESGE